MFSRNVFVAIRAQLVGSVVSDSWQRFEHIFRGRGFRRRRLCGSGVCLLRQTLRWQLRRPYLRCRCLCYLRGSRWALWDSAGAFRLRGPAALSWLRIIYPFRQMSVLLFLLSPGPIGNYSARQPPTDGQPHTERSHTIVTSTTERQVWELFRRATSLDAPRTVLGRIGGGWVGMGGYYK